MVPSGWLGVRAAPRAAAVAAAAAAVLVLRGSKRGRDVIKNPQILLFVVYRTPNVPLACWKPVADSC